MTAPTPNALQNTQIKLAETVPQIAQKALVRFFVSPCDMVKSMVGPGAATSKVDKKMNKAIFSGVGISVF